MKTKSPFLNSVVECMYSRHYAKKSIETYIGWIYTLSYSIFSFDDVYLIIYGEPHFETAL